MAGSENLPPGGFSLKKNAEVITISEIARLSGVSIGTVDRVIHGRGKVSAKNQQKIAAVIKRYNYKPNIMARHLKRNSSLKVGLFFPEDLKTGMYLPFLHNGTSRVYWDLVIQGIERAVETLGPFNIQIVPGFWGSPASPEEEIDALILSPSNPEKAFKLLERTAGIPYVLIDSPLENASPLVTIMQNPLRGGQTAGRVMRLLKGRGHFVCLHIYTQAYNVIERSRGFKDFFSDDPDVRISEVVNEGFIPRQVFQLLDRIFAGGQVDGIFVPHAEANIIADYLVGRKLKSRVALIGYDNVPLNREALLSGAIDCLIAQRPENQGYLAMCEIYHKCVLNQEREKIIEIPIDVYFPENI
ncbi:MAG: LacI family transcriptional regulator [Treponema sp.]|jgi:LacI family transcriptional regulator|nr:LacI family transcriptional regulator [Treponema sp.]